MTTYAVTGLAGGTTYYYRLRAVNASGPSANSNVITVLTVPAAPAATAASAVSAAGFNANWGAVTGAASYRLDVSTSNAFGTFLAGYQDVNVNNVTTYAVTGLTPSATYYYRLRAVNASGTSADSNVITVLTVPAAPVATAATAIASASFQANWLAAGGATSYRLDVSTSNAFGTFVAGYHDLNVNDVTAYAVTGLASNTTYYYRLRAASAGGSSMDSNVISLTTLQVHTVRFTASEGGHLGGQLTQAIDNGGDCTAVRAVADPGYRFVEWTGTGNFHSLKNPVTVAGVLADMTIRATFINPPPAIRIVNPIHQASAWGLVSVCAEVSDDMALRSIDFLVDGAAPLAIDPTAGQSAGTAQPGCGCRAETCTWTWKMPTCCCWIPSAICASWAGPATCGPWWATTSSCATWPWRAATACTWSLPSRCAWRTAAPIPGWSVTSRKARSRASRAHPPSCPSPPARRPSSSTPTATPTVSRPTNRAAPPWSAAPRARMTGPSLLSPHSFRSPAGRSATGWSYPTPRCCCLSTSRRRRRLPT